MVRTNSLLEFPFDDSATGVSATVRTEPHEPPSTESLSPAELAVAYFATETKGEHEVTAYVADEFDTERSPEEIVASLREREILLPEDHPQFHEGDKWLSHDWRRGLYYHADVHGSGQSAEQVRTDRLAAVAADATPPAASDDIGLPTVDDQTAPGCRSTRRCSADAHTGTSVEGR